MLRRSSPAAVGIVIWFWLFAVAPAARPQPSQGGVPEARHVMQIPLPPGVTAGELADAGAPLKEHLHEFALEQMRGGGRVDADIVLFVDKAGRPVLPDREKSSKRGRPTRNDLTLTFDASWTAEEVTSLQAASASLYPVIKAIYGDPAFSIELTVIKTTGLSSDGAYNASLNEILLPDADVDVLCHEMIHAFRDDNIILLNTFEEGMTRAAEVEVFNRLPAYPHWDRNHSYTYDVYYEALNRSSIGSAGGSFWWGYVAPLLRYQLASYAWGKILIENPAFLANFNAVLYGAVLDNPSVTSTESQLVSIASRVRTTVEGKPFVAWYGQQQVLNTAPPAGQFIYQRVNQYVVDVFTRDEFGVETMQAGAPVNWTMYDYQGAPLASGSTSTGDLGWADLFPSGTPVGYAGRVGIVVTSGQDPGVISDTSLRSIGTDESGIFGVVDPEISGEITIKPLDAHIPPVTAAVTNGAFSIPSLGPVRGRFRAVFTGDSGRRLSKIFTKDASAYFLLMAQ